MPDTANLAPLPSPLPSPLSYPNAISRPAVPTHDERQAALKHIALMLMKLTGCSRDDAQRVAQAAVRMIEEARRGT